MADKYEYQDEQNYYFNLYGANWQAQTFTPQTTHQVTAVKLQLMRVGNGGGTAYASIRATDGEGKPTGEDLGVGQLNTSTVTMSSPGQLCTFPIADGPTLQASTKYAIVARIPGGDGSNFCRLYSKKTPAPYPYGAYLSSANSGSTWTENATYDLTFEDWGIIPPALPAVQTNEADGITHAQATLHGTLADDGGEACDVRFQYGETTAYGTDTEWQPDKVSTDTFEQLIANLDGDKTYHFRAQAKNSVGTSSGVDKEFTTEEMPPTPGVHRKVTITHPALKTVRVIRGGVEQTKYDNLSNLDEGFIHGELQLPVEPPAIVEVTTLANQVYKFQIPQAS